MQKQQQLLLSQPLLDVLDTDQQSAVKNIFNTMDCDGNGMLSNDEVKKFFAEEGQRTPRALNLLDVNGDGNVTFVEWVNFLEQLAKLLPLIKRRLPRLLLA